jgi:large subunit ribosomal protein L31
MKQDIHPNYHNINVVCTCGNTFETQSTYHQDKLSIEICSKCHPFYTGEQKIIDTEGNVEKFNKKFGKKKADTAK